MKSTVLIDPLYRSLPTLPAYAIVVHVAQLCLQLGLSLNERETKPKEDGELEGGIQYS